MSKKIRGITIELDADASGIEKALKDVDKQLYSTQRELKDVERLLKMDPKNTELLKQKFDLLEKSVGDTKDKLDALKKAEKEVQEQMKKGKASERQYNALRREIIDTERKLGNLEDEAKLTERALNGIDEKPIEDVSHAAKKAEDSLEDAGKEASNFGDYLKAEAIVEGAKAIVGAMKDVADESKEFIKIMGSLEVSSEAAGYSAEETKETYKKLYGVLGDEQGAATTTANLQALGIEQSKLQELTNGMIGAWSKYGDSIPIDGLAEAVNETVKAGQVTGNFADLLNWGAVEGETFGVKLKKATKANEEWNNAVKEAKTAEDFFNLALQDCANETERANLIMQFMTDQGLAKAGEAWRKNNKELVENNEAQAELQEQIARLVETVMPIFTEITEYVADFLENTPEIEEFLKNIVDEAGEFLKFIVENGPIVVSLIGGIGAGFVTWKVASMIKGVTDGIKAFKLANEAATISQIIFDGVLKMSPIGVITTLIVGLVAAFILLWKNCEGFRKFWKDLWEGIKEGTKIGVNGIITFLNWIIGGMNKLIKGINNIEFKTPDWLGGKEIGFNIKTIGKIPMLASGGILTKGSAIVGEAGPELLTMQGNSAIVQPLTNQTTRTTNLGGVNIVIYGAPGQNVEELAELVSEKISDTVSRKEAVFA